MFSQQLNSVLRMPDSEERNSLLQGVLASTTNHGVVQKILDALPSGHPVIELAIDRLAELKESPLPEHQVYGNTHEENMKKDAKT